MDDTTAAIDAALSGGLAAYAISQGQTVNNGNITTAQPAVSSNSLLWLAVIFAVGVFAFWSLAKG